SAALGLTFYASAFLAEVWRGCLQAIPAGQWDAARALGLAYPRQLRLVIMPQALKIAIPPTVGIMVQMLKGTSLASIIGFTELTAPRRWSTTPRSARSRFMQPSPPCTSRYAGRCRCWDSTWSN